MTEPGPPLRTLEEVAAELAVPVYRVQVAAGRLQEKLRLYPVASRLAHDA